MLPTHIFSQTILRILYNITKYALPDDFSFFRKNIVQDDCLGQSLLDALAFPTLKSALMGVHLVWRS